MRTSGEHKKTTKRFGWGNCIRFPLLILAAALEPVLASEAPDFSRYSGIETFGRVMANQTNGALYQVQTNLLMIAEFYGENSCVQWVVTQDGHFDKIRWSGVSFKSFLDLGRVSVASVGNPGDVATKSSGSIIGLPQLLTNDVNKIRSAISELPPNSELPPFHRLIVVSFSAGTNWVMKSYDSQSVPDAVHQIVNVVEAPLVPGVSVGGATWVQGLQNGF